jgi:uncharacterized membrane protein YfcA
LPVDLLPFAILFAVGLAAGALNVIAGGGSFLSLPVLIFVGLPATLANGTNRVAILLQNVGAVWGFNRHRVLDWRWGLWVAGPATVGAGLGTWGALVVGDVAFTRILAFLMVAVTLATLLHPVEGSRTSTDEPPASPGVAVAAAFFAVGLYGGFVQAGVGFLVLAATTACGLDLVRGNAIKVLAILVFTVLSLGIFAWQGMVSWPHGLALAGGNVLGGQLGVRLTVLKGHRWLRGVVVAAVIVFAIKLWLSP